MKLKRQKLHLDIHSAFVDIATVWWDFHILFLEMTITNIFSKSSIAPKQTIFSANTFKLIIHSFVYAHGVAPRKTAVKCCSHHSQGISLSTDRKTRIDFEKTCGMDRFWKGITRKKPFAKRMAFFNDVFRLRGTWCALGAWCLLRKWCALRAWESGTHHIILRHRRNTSLWRSHNIIAATPQHHSKIPPCTPHDFML